MATGEGRGCYALSESGGSSFAKSIRSKAVKKGDMYIINGEKIFITEAQRSQFGIFVVRIGETEDGIGAFIIPNAEFNNGNGYKVIGKEDKPGLKASSTCRILLEDVKVSEENLLGLDYGNRRGLSIAVKTLGYSRPAIAAQALGNAKAALSYVIDYALQTPRGDGTISLLDLPHYQTEVGRLLELLNRDLAFLWVTAAAIDNGDVKELPLRILSSQLKASATETAQYICSECMGLLGGHGYNEGHSLARRWRDSGVPPIYEGANMLQRVNATQYLKNFLTK